MCLVQMRFLIYIDTKFLLIHTILKTQKHYNMKKLSLLILMFCISLNLFAQDELNKVSLRIGESLESIKKDVPTAEMKHSTENGDYLFQDAEHVWVFYYFNKNICHVQMYAYNVSSAAEVFKLFSDPSEYVKISNMEYIRVEENKVLIFKLSIENNLLIIVVTS